MIDIDALLDTARTVVAEGAAMLRTVDSGTIHAKGDRDFVTDLDLRIQWAVQQRLREATPWAGFLGEETDAHRAVGEAEYTWTLDPIDGTSNFIHGLPLCAVSLALVRSGTPVIGVVNAPFLGLEYYAADHRGAFCNGASIAASAVQNIGDAIVSIGDYAVGEYAAAENRHRLAITGALAASAERVRMFGSAALDLVWVAEGRTDGTVIMSNKTWDMAAGVVIAREGGAIVTDSNGSPHTVNARHTIAANPRLSEELVSLVSAARKVT
ncbi:inositol monophosphatase [Nocardia cyriacigeorgica]|uniref:Inositol-1-monophosphatase n=1 Tax=Nocardia cyriacigeorgica TaxID=135487 RepID=A0A5R8PDM5_9NOCA|nr:inositol monophosphatase family protein [Nocardia cyriacigeorgica]TLG09484.1 inositol monophosphatase [Nocardia cyriacigeorgica]